MFSKTGRLLFLSMVSEVTVRKQNSQQALLQVKKVTVQNIGIGFWTVTSNHNVKYLVSADLLFLIKNIMCNGFCLEGLQICSEYVRHILIVETLPNDISSDNEGIIVRSSSTIKMFVETGPRGVSLLQHQVEFTLYCQ